MIRGARNNSYVVAVQRAYARGRQSGFGYNGTVSASANPYSRSDLRKAWEDGRLEEIAKLAKADAKMKAQADKPAFDVNEVHFHVCPACLHIWSHTPAQSMIAGNTKSHKCPECKKGKTRDGWRTMAAAVTDRGKLRAALAQAPKQAVADD